MSFDKFSAKDQALGYFYEVRYALYLLLKEPGESKLYIEKLDDVVFYKDDSTENLQQLKHSLNCKASLQDSSKDLWKSIRVWSTRFYNREIVLPGTMLTLITTGEVKENYIAALLRPDDSKRNSKLASQRLSKIARTSNNNELEKAFEAYLMLSEEDRALLTSSMYVLDLSPNIINLQSKIKGFIEIATDKENLNKLYERLEGWWLNEVLLRLCKESDEPITRHEIRKKIREIDRQFEPESLTIDYSHESPKTPINIENDNRLFVIQMKEIALRKERIESCMLDYYRAYKQRSKWIREDPLIGREIKEYDDKLVREWQHIFWSHQDDIHTEECGEEDFRKCGRKIFDHIYLMMPLVNIRKNVTEPYVMRGSYHILADEKQPETDTPKVYWHPKFLEIMNDKNII